MGKHKKEHKKESKKRKHRSKSRSPSEKEKRKHHKKHHKEKKREKCLKKVKSDVSSISDDDVIYVSPTHKPKEETPPPPPPPPKISTSPPPETAPATQSSGGDNSLSVEETNILRAKLGLKPLAVKKEVSENGDVTVGEKKEFVHKPAEDITAKKLAEKIRSRIVERREKREIEKKLKTIKSIAEESDEEDVSKWVKKSRQLQEERVKAEQKAKELDEMDEVFGIGELVKEEIKIEKKAAYTAANLRGLKVEHDLETFMEGKDVVLTLKDKDVLDEENTDVLVNVNLIDDERYKKNVENKKQKPYNYNAVDSGEMDVDEPKGVLTKYDEEIDGAKKTSFVIGMDNSATLKESIKAKLKQKAKMTLDTLQLPEPKIASEYYSQDEMVKFNKPKKKRKIKSRTLKADDLLSLVNGSTNGNDEVKQEKDGVNVKDEIKAEPMDIDEEVPMVFENVRIEEDDDTELELALKKARRLKQTPIEKLAARLPKVEEVLLEIKDEPQDDGLGGSIVLNSTAEFCRTLGDIPTYGLAGNREDGPSVILDFEKDNIEKKKKEETDGRSGGWNDVEMDEKVAEIKQPEAPILDAEPDLGSGVAGALRLAVSKGYLEKETVSRPSASRFSHLAAQNYSIDDKAHQGDDDKLGRRERYMGPTSEFKEKDGYKPNIKLEYIDDDGHLLSAKEAFRYLSHKFHGKGPGKNKVEKRMKKNEQEGLMKQMSSTDTPLGTLQMLQQKQKETQSAFVVLSGSKQTNIPASISKTKMLK